MGTSDLANDLHAPHTRDRLPMLTSLGLCILAARAFGLAILDGVHLDLDDMAGFEEACRQGHEMGFDGKTLIHPKTIDDRQPHLRAHGRTRSPGPQRIIAAHAAAVAEGKGIVVVDGKLIENLHVLNARRLVDLAERDRRTRERGVSAARPIPAASSRISGSARRSPMRRRAAVGRGRARALYRADRLRASRSRARMNSPARSASCQRRRWTTAGLPSRLRPQRARYLAERRGQSRLCRGAVRRRRSMTATRLTARSTVIGLKENSNRETGTVYVRTDGRNQRGETVLSYRALGHGAQARQDGAGASGGRPGTCRRACPSIVPRCCPPRIDLAGYDTACRGQLASLGGLRARRADRSSRRHDHRRILPYDGDAALPEHRQGSISTSMRRRTGASAGASSMAAMSSAWPAPSASTGSANAFRIAAINGGRHRQSLLRRRHRLCLERGRGKDRACRAGAIAGALRLRHHRHQGSALRRFSRPRGREMICSTSTTP